MTKRKNKSAAPTGPIVWENTGTDRWVGRVPDDPKLTFEAFLWWDMVTATPYGVEVNRATITLIRGGDMVAQATVRIPPYDKNDCAISIGYLQNAAEMLLAYENAKIQSIYEEEE